jgi:hypothetical protein
MLAALLVRNIYIQVKFFVLIFNLILLLSPMESSSATTPLPPGTPPPVPPGPSVVASGPVAATVASGSGDATERRKWKKMTAAECKTAGIDVDPIFQYIMEDLYPIFKVDIQTPVGGEKREDYVNRTLFPLVNAKFDIEGPNGYHTGDFKDVRQSRCTPFH